MAAHDPGSFTLKKFAAMNGWSPSYVTELKQAGRLVLTEDGKRVLHDASIALIRETSDPAKAGVAARHAAARGAGASRPTDPQTDAGDGEDGAAAAPADPVEANHQRRRAKALADKAETDAKVAERDYQISMGQLLPAADVEQAVRAAAATFRGALENLPNILAPQLSAMTDEGRIRVVLAEAFEHSLEELSRLFASIGRREAGE